MDRQLLIADDDLGVVRSLARFFASTCDVVMARSASEALTLVERRDPWSGAIIDYKFPDGDGLDVLSAFRQRLPHAPALLLSGDRSDHVIHRASVLGASFVVKPPPDEVLRAFGSRVVTPPVTAALNEAIREAAQVHALSPGETRVLREAVRGADRDAIGGRLGLAETTIRTQVRNLIRKCGADQLHDVVRGVWERVSSVKR
jgi:DNA-binding NarL/FixJ family response regulator